MVFIGGEETTLSCEVMTIFASGPMCTICSWHMVACALLSLPEFLLREQVPSQSPSAQRYRGPSAARRNTRDSGLKC